MPREPRVYLNRDVPATPGETPLDGVGERSGARTQLHHDGRACPGHRSRRHPGQGSTARRDRTDRQGIAHDLQKRALTGDDPAGAAAEAEELLAATMLDPPRWGIAFHYGLIAEMRLAAGMPVEAAAALDRADRFLDVYDQRYSEGLLLLLRAQVLNARGEPITVVRAAAERARQLSIQREAHLFAHRAQRFLAEL